MTSPKPGEILRVPTTCAQDCGGKCLLYAHVKDGVIVRYSSDEGDDPQLRGCARGRAYRQRVYSPDRIKYPMKRIGERGEGKFERISWDEALDKVASEMKKIKAAHGPGAFVNMQYSGAAERTQQYAVGRLLNRFGGNLQHWGGASMEGNQWAIKATYGPLPSSTMRIDLDSSKFIMAIGYNPAEMIATTNTTYHLIKAKEAGKRFVWIEPRFTNSAAVFANQWVPIIPGTDTALLIAMAYVVITNGLEDSAFIEAHTHGFEQFSKYVLGQEDGIPKTPAWAEPITSIPAATIEKLARDYATSKPATMLAGWGPGRTAYGEQYFRAGLTLAAITGNPPPGIVPWKGGLPRVNIFTKGKNPYDEMGNLGHGVKESLDPAVKSKRRLLQADVYDAILKGKAGGYPEDIKMVWVSCGNTLNQIPNTNKGVAAFKKVEFIVVLEQLMTPTAKFADILLPATTHLEREDIYYPWSGGPYCILANKAIEPMFEAKSDVEICTALAERLGINNYNDKTDEQWMRDTVTKTELANWITDYDAAKRQGFYKLPREAQTYSCNQYYEGLKSNPPHTPTRKIEIYSQTIADMNNPGIPPVPKYIETWEGRNDPLARKYPLQLLTSQFKMRAHSSFSKMPWLEELDTQKVWINTADAEARGIQNGDQVRVLNDRGVVIIPAWVTERIMPGVVNLCEGAWYSPDSEGNDRGGCANVLTASRHSPAGAWCTHTSLVQVARA